MLHNEIMYSKFGREYREEPRMEILRKKFWTILASLHLSRIFPSPSPIRHRILTKPSPITRFLHTSAVLLILSCLFFSSPPAQGSGYEEQYGKARTDYYALKNSEKKKKYRSYWLSCIEEFRAVYTQYPKSPRADDALFTMAMLYHDLYGYSFLKSDLQEALSSFQTLVERYSSSRFADDAQFKIGEIYLNRKEFSRAYMAFQKVVDLFPRGDMVSKARATLKELEEYKPEPLAKEVKGLSSVKDIRYWSNPDYTRVVIYVDEQVSYKEHRLRRDPSIKKPGRLYIDIDSAVISPDLKQPIPIHDGLLKMARAAQNTPGTVRVVLDIESIKDYKIFPLNGPLFQIVIDIFGDFSSEGKALAAIEKKQPLLPPSDPGIKRIVIDPGHGGRDPGAIGPSGLKEKDVVLKIAKELKKKLNTRGYEVFLTRERDIYLPLPERTAIANTKNADLFLSIHANASRKRGAQGIETYIYNFPSDEEARELAARENAISPEELTDLQYILYDLMATGKVNESSRLAHHVQHSLCYSLNHRYSDNGDRGIKQAPFYVLMGARMPAILVEVSFISNRLEERRLKSRKYQDKIVAAIGEGLNRYVEETKEAYRASSSPREASTDRISPGHIIVGRMERGSCLYTSLKKRGVSLDQISLITAHLKPIFDFKDCNPGDTFRVYLDNSGQVQRFEYEANLSHVYEVIRDGDRYVASKKELILDRHLTRVEGEIESSLFDAIEESDEGDRLALAFADIFAWEIDFHNDPRKGDRFNILVEKFYKDGQFIRYGNVLAATYNTPSQAFKGYYFKDQGGREGYYDEKGRSLEKHFLRSPLKFTRITSGYTRRRRHPILGGYHPHLAVDYAAPTGTPIQAVADGKVVFRGWNRGYGRQVAIKHGNGYTTYYNHLSRYGRGIKKGKRVKQKQIIGYVGSTGLATGPHLDYRIAKNGKFLDPLKMKSPPISSIDSKHRADFEAERDYLASLLR